MRPWRILTERLGEITPATEQRFRIGGRIPGEADMAAGKTAVYPGGGLH